MDAYPRTDLGADQRSGSPNLPALEKQVLRYWDQDDTFRASIANRGGAPEYVFTTVRRSPMGYRTTGIC